MANRSEIRAMLIDERTQLHRFLSGLTDEQWETPSLCSDWSVLEVAGHLASVVGLTRFGMFGRNLRYGAGTDGGNMRAARDWAAKGPDAIVAALGDPRRLGLGLYFPRWALAETLVHHHDIRQPLGFEQPMSHDRVEVALGVFLKLAMVTKDDRRWRRVTLRATDMDWSEGTGPVIEGPAASILLAMSGRLQAFEDLSGDGCELVQPAGDAASKRR